MASAQRNLGKLLLIGGLVSLPLLIVIAYALLSGGSGNNKQMAVVEWQLLRELDMVSGEAPESLKKFDGMKVRVPGFMVPLEDNRLEVTEFLLVPNPQACIHVPPPPANQMVLVRMVGDKNTKMAYGPIWAEGTLRITPGKHMYGTSSFSMMADATEPYKP